MKKLNALVVDDREDQLEVMGEGLSRLGYNVTSAMSGSDALRLLDREPIDVIISDYNMRPMDGLKLLETVRRSNTEIPFIIFTGGSADIGKEAIEKGAQDFLTKGPTLLVELEARLERIWKDRSENKELKDELRNRWNYVGTSSNMMEIRNFTEAIAKSRSAVLISGESGTGKELIARWIHYHSPRKPGPFIKINCAALPDGLIESELFGYEKGAFTGALKRKIGKFEAASGGTLLLDEIGEMPMGAQAKLLRVIQEREIDVVGGEKPVQIDVRILAASNRNLETEIEKGNFREDLYYRLNVFHVELPPLRERKEDIIQLADHFIEKYNDIEGYNVEGLAPGCEEKLLSYNWPGNIRELESAMQRAVILTGQGLIQPKMLEFSSRATDKLQQPLIGIGGLTAGTAAIDAGAGTDKPQAAASGGSGLTAGMTIADAEKELIIITLEHCAQNKTKAADMLGISVRTLRNKLNEYALETTGTDEE